MTVITYPSVLDYTVALQNPATAFNDASLRTATFAQGPFGPYCIAGSSAVVFHATVGAEDYAVRCYTRQDASTPERYAELDKFVSANQLSKHVGIVTWYQDQVQVKGARWPVLKMEWIAGQQLNEYVGYLADNGNKAALNTLADRWLVLIGELQRVGFAHGDLQHGNILVDGQGQLRLVDFDSVWIPALQGQAPPTESGHPSYQSQGATPKTRWGPFMDSFSGLVIYLALIALARDPRLWAQYNNGDNLLFERDDFSPALNKGIWQSLAGLGDKEVDWVAAKLTQCFAPGWTPTKSLRDMLRAAWWDTQGAAIKSVALGTGTEQTGNVQTPAGEGAAQTAPQPAWYAPSVPSQPAAPAGSLPPPKTAYQSAVAPQTTGPQPVVGATKDGGRSWWGAEQPAKKPAEPKKAEPKKAEPKKSTPPTTTTKSTPAKQKSPDGSPVASVFAAVFIIGAIVTFLALTANHAAAAGAGLGIVLFLIGIGIADAARPKKKKPPSGGGGNPPAAGGGTKAS